MAKSAKDPAGPEDAAAGRTPYKRAGPASVTPAQRKRIGAMQGAEKLAQCWPARKVSQWLQGEHGISERQSWRWIAEARALMLTWFPWERQREMVAEQTARLEMIAAKAIATDQLRAAVAAIRQICEISGLNSARQIADMKSTLKGEIDALRQQLERRDGRKRGGDLPLEAFNTMRGIYGQAELTATEYAAYKAAYKGRTIALH